MNLLFIRQYILKIGLKWLLECLVHLTDSRESDQSNVSICLFTHAAKIGGLSIHDTQVGNTPDYLGKWWYWLGRRSQTYIWIYLQKSLFL